jgi:glyoxylase-like metal-dependent hydrolase (beta-lactamase superfamily II)
MKAVSVHEDAVVVTSLMWQTTTTAIRAGGETMLIDSPYFPEELDLLPAVLSQSGFEPTALLATHGDFDHLLAPLAFPGMSLGVAESTLARIRAKPGEAQRELRDEDSDTYVTRPAPLGLGKAQSLPVPGKLGLGEEELELHPTAGHVEDGMAILAPWMGVLCVGDYVSDVEIPWMHESGSLPEYRGTLARLAELVERAEVVVPGHGTPHTRDRALGLIEEDVEYLDELERGGDALPEGRDTKSQRSIHAENLGRLA